MPQTNYQEPIEKEDLDLANKFQSGSKKPEAKNEGPPDNEKGGMKIPDVPEVSGVPAPEAEKMPSVETETGSETSAEEQSSEKIETARKAIQTQKSAAQASVSDDASAVLQIPEYEKKIDKLMEIAIHKGPDYAIKVARHMDKGKPPAQADNFTLDEIHDKLMEDELRKQLMQKGLLKEL